MAREELRETKVVFGTVLAVVFIVFAAAAVRLNLSLVEFSAPPEQPPCFGAVVTKEPAILVKGTLQAIPVLIYAVDERVENVVLAPYNRHLEIGSVIFAEPRTLKRSNGEPLNFFVRVPKCVR